MPSVDLRPRKRHPRDKRPAKPMPFDVAMRKFKKQVEKAGIIQECRKREFYEKPAQRKQRKKAEAIARWRKKEKAMQLKPERRY
tara:strand:- start:2804 stop:3055 length:252 start_codon:yes stop_codon:yes gene_type:complete